jgi:feruloyl esterase
VPHCLVEGFVTTTNPGPNRNNFRLQLPDDFAGRYYFIGLGGAAGGLPSESQSPAGNPIVKGFAVAGTDTGHQGAFSTGASSTTIAPGDRPQRSRAHVTAVATQQITKTYYAVSSLRRYHSGASGGAAWPAMAAALRRRTTMGS